MATYDEIIALSESNKHNFGMSAEEISRRQELIKRVAQHSPDLAMDMAKGPYRMNGGQAPQPQTQTAQGTPSQGSLPSGNYAMTGSQQYPAGQIPATTTQSNMKPVVSPTGVPQGRNTTPSGAPVYGPPTQSGQYPAASRPVTDFTRSSAPPAGPTYSGGNPSVPGSTVNINIVPPSYNQPPAGDSAPFGSVPFSPQNAAQGYHGAGGASYPPVTGAPNIAGTRYDFPVMPPRNVGAPDMTGPRYSFPPNMGQPGPQAGMANPWRPPTNPTGVSMPFAGQNPLFPNYIP